MILRAGALVLLVYLVGFILFSVTLGKPAPKDTAPTDAIVVLTGGPGRIEHAFAALKARGGKRLLIAGTDPSVTKKDLIRRLGGQKALVNCCVDLDSASVDTRSNAEETRRWLERRRYSSVRLITSDYHMRRARYEFRRALGAKFKVVPDAVKTEARFTTLFGEYNDYVLRRIAVWFDV